MVRQQLPLALALVVLAMSQTGAAAATQSAVHVGSAALRRQAAARHGASQYQHAAGGFWPARRLQGGDGSGCDAMDISQDGVINVPDLLGLLTYFGCSGGDCCPRCDSNDDGRVNVVDILTMLSWFNVRCGPEVVEPPFAEAMNASAADPFAPLVAVSSAITFEGDAGLITDSAPSRVEFEQGFAAAVAGGLGDPGDGSAVDPDVVIVDDIRGADGNADAIAVLFHLLLPDTLQLTGAAMVTTMQQSGLTIEVAVEAVNTTFVADTSSTEEPEVSPAVVDCEGSWIASDDCSEPCGPDGTRAQEFVVSRAEQNGGADCADAEVLPAARPCNTHVQCPVDCSGEWGGWGECSLPCGGGNRTSNYVVLEEPQHGGAECPERDSSRSQECNTEPCPPPPPEPVDCVGSWSEYGECSHPCGESGLQLRTFTVSVVASNGGSACAADAGAVESLSCNTEIQCPIDCEGEWSDFGECSEVCGPGNRTRRFHVTVAAEHGGSCPEEGLTESQDCDNLCPTGLAERDVEAGLVNLPVSGRLELATLVKVAGGGEQGIRGSAIPVGRSYNGNEWEGTMPSPVTFVCTEEPSVTCSATLPAGAVYQLRTYNGTDVVGRGPKTVASRFLTQATFGPTLAEIDSLTAATAEQTEADMEDWLLDQMVMEPTLHRAYHRRRLNGQTYGAIANMRPPCQEGSSWVSFAFSKFDRGKEVDVSLVSGSDSLYALSIEGVVRTVVESTKDIREDIGWSCYKRGFRTPLDMPGTNATIEASAEACHQRCNSTNGCGFFSFHEFGDGACHLQAPGNHGIVGRGGPWRTGSIDCSASVYTYPSAESDDSGLLNMGAGCWGQCGAHGSCPGRCGENGYCCRYGRDRNGCVTTDPTQGSHRCIPNPALSPPPPAPAPRLQANTSYLLCFVNEYEGGDVSLLVPGTPLPGGDWKVSSCQSAAADQIIIGNPAVNLVDPAMAITQQLDGAADLVPITAGGVRNSFSLRNVVEGSCELPYNPTVFIRLGDKYYRHEPRVELVENTVDSPYIEQRITHQTDRSFIPALTPTFCPAARPAFTNARGCVRQNSCSQPEWTDGTVLLDDDLLRLLFTNGQKYVYAITGFREMALSSDSPCSAPSRWKKTAGPCDVDTPLDEATLASISAALLGSSPVLDTAFVTDIETVATDCVTESEAGVAAMGAALTLNGTCYQHVHPSEYNVYDMAYWTPWVPRAADGSNPLTSPAVLGQTELQLPDVCSDLSCWPTRFSGRNPTPLVRLLGALGQAVEFRALPTTVQRPWLADLAGVENVAVDPGVSESCGSVGEVANDPAFGHKYGGRYSGAQKPTYWPKAMLWQNAVFSADDQLRQRVAWGLSQIYVVSEVGYEGSEGSNAKYYDIFVRRAFGNFRDLIKEVAYSYPMADMLTFINSRSAAVSGDFADENFARECIQLFTVGLEHLNPDGTPVLDEAGNHVPTYGVKDVASFARTWTGFRSPGGLRTNKAGGSDMLVINPTDRDASPKMDLLDGFIGDGYPACVDLPERAYLRKGFSYAYRGDTVEHLDNLKDGAGVVAFLTLEDPSSSLYQALCEPAAALLNGSSAAAACTFPSKVTLTQSLPCSGFECGVDRAPLVRVITGSGSVAFYEAIEFPCTKFPFFNNGQFVKFGAPFINTMSCSDPRSAAAAPLCCSDDATDGTGNARCEYYRERVTYATAHHRCENRGVGQDVCQGNAAVSGWPSCHPFSQWRFSTWMGRVCSTQVQIQRDGRVSVVHAGDLVDNSAMNARIEPESVHGVISIGSKSVFDVVWSGDAYPQAVNGCAADSATNCTVIGETCLCEVEAVSTAVFSDIPTATEVKGLKVGALDPTAYDGGEYVRCTSEICDAADVGVWSKRMRMHEALQLEIEEVNIALGRPTSASSNLGGSTDALVVDGRTGEGLFHSACSGQQWVQVDLEQVTRIDSVKLWHRTDCCGSRINGATILISDTPDPSTGVQCGDAITWVSGATLNACRGITGRYVTVWQQQQTCLQVMELEVLVEAINTDDGYVYAPELYDFVSASDDLVLNESTIFEVPSSNGTAVAFYKNQDLRVQVQDYSFRNPPTFMDFEHPTLQQAELETDAVLEHLTTHPSTAPFICKKLIQRLTSSNPSPRYVLEVVTAFSTGEYGGRLYSGQYGDLGAATAAIFLDREARDPTLDMDPAAGKLREPLLKILHAMRSLEFVPNNGMEFEMPHLQLVIGMQAYRSPSVFNFYEPDYVPAGPASKASLYAPEAEILTTPFVIGYMNGMASLVDNGLSSCDRGFGNTGSPSPSPHLYMPSHCGSSTEAKHMTSNGVLTYEHQGREGVDVVAELALLLTGGREPPAIRAYWDESQVPVFNVALNKTTTVSSEWHGGSHGGDEVTDGRTDDESLFHSLCGGLQWVQVDLETETVIDAVKIWHRTNCCQTRINGGTILISDTPDFESGVQCAAPLVHTGAPTSTLSCPGTAGRYVTVRLEGTCLQVKELEVLARGGDGVGEGLVPAWPVPSAADLLPTLTKLFTFSSEYAATNLNTLREHPRLSLPEIPTQNRQYKAVIVIFLEGGADSFNMLIPHSGCVRDLYAEYAEIRSNIALPLDDILPMELDGEHNTQPCATFATHPALGFVKTLWDAGDASWFANIGSLVEPTTRDQFVGKTVAIPPLLFGHSAQQRQCQSVHAQNSGANGVLGRMVEALTKQDSPYRSKVYSIYGIRKLVEGDVPPTVIGAGGVVRFSQYGDLAPVLHAMTGSVSDSIFADTYAEVLERSLVSTQRLGAQMGAVVLLGDYSGGTGMVNVAKVMALDPAVHESERDVFMVGVRTFDAHQNAAHMDINMLLGKVNADIAALHTDLVALGLWESTTIVSISDFGRTITSNGIGTDHAWGGNNFILGGAVNGRRIHGQFPEDLNPATSELEVGRGRGVFVPTTPWEGMWYGVSQWFGVDEDRLLTVVPNAANFGDDALFSAAELFNITNSTGAELFNMTNSTAG